MAPNKFYFCKKYTNKAFASQKQKKWCEEILGIRLKTLFYAQANELIKEYCLSKKTGALFRKSLYLNLLIEQTK